MPNDQERADDFARRLANPSRPRMEPSDGRQPDGSLPNGTDPREDAQDRAEIAPTESTLANKGQKGQGMIPKAERPGASMPASQVGKIKKPRSYLDG
jgi:hypothetical protein